jgi:hypothetical protein
MKKMQYIEAPVITLFLLLAAFFTAKADTWEDPSWKEMLDKSDVVASIQYTSTGTFRAQAKVMKAYKGNLKTGDVIWISGFSNRYGPIDTMNIGDQYLVFLHFDKPQKDEIKSWKEELKENPDLKEYINAYKNKIAYFVWSPTSGDYNIKEQKIACDLIQTTQYGRLPDYSLSEFEVFLRNYYRQESKTDFCASTLTKLTATDDEYLITQYLMQLYLIGHKDYASVFENYVKHKNPAPRYALAHLLGNIKTETSRNILVQLLDDEHSLVQGEAVRQLKNEPADFVGPVLVKRLSTANTVDFGPSNVMNPVVNRISGGQAEMIQTLGALRYRPAVPYLIPLLESNDEQTFRLVIDALKSIGSKDYIPYLNKHIDKKTKNLMYYISNLITDENLIECIPNLKNFIKTCDRNGGNGYDFVISTCCGLGHFKDSATISFLYSDFKHFFTHKDTLESNNQIKWIERYIETFMDLKVKDTRPLVYKAIFDWTGFNEDFSKFPKLFGIKKNLEDSIRVAFAAQIANKGYQLDHVLAFVENTNEVVSGTKPKANFLVEVTIPGELNEEEVKTLLVGKLNLPLEQIFLRYSNGTYIEEVENRFQTHSISSLWDKFFDYVKVIHTKPDIAFLQSLMDNQIITDEFDRKKVTALIKALKMKL